MTQPVHDKFGRPLRDIRISVTDRCNLRCPYCMPAEVFHESFKFLPRAELLNFQEIHRIALAFVELGVTKIRITGGEPLLRTGLPDLLRSLSGIQGLEDLTLTTNGLLLPREAQALHDSGLHRMTVSLDSLDPQVFRTLAGRDVHPQAVLDGIAAAESAGFSALKINCVVKRGVNDHTILGLVEHFRGTGHILRFIEYMDVGTMNGWELSHVVSGSEILKQVETQHAVTAIEPQDRGEVARRYRLNDGSLEIGVITSVSQPFCGDCSRARLTTQGELVTCLFASKGLDLRGPLRAGATDQELKDLVSSHWRVRQDRYSEERTEQTAKAKGRIEMFRLGG
jgi:cyclic pyranopterin phosphate synthase